MRYRLTCLSPTHIGDGQRLSPIDYMVWKDQVNVLDQRRIIKMLAKGPRLESYLAQVSRATRLDFAQWGGYAQNYASRRIPLEHPSLAKAWEQAQAASLHIPTFAQTFDGPMLPGSALRGAIRTSLVFGRWQRRGADKVLEQVSARIEGDRVPRRPAAAADDQVPPASFGDGRRESVDLKVFHVRTSRWQGALSWKETAPSFVEMAAPGSAFSGTCELRGNVSETLAAANRWSLALLELHLAYAKQAGLAPLGAALEGLRFRAASASSNQCVLSIGWGAGFLSKTGVLDTNLASYRGLLKRMPLYTRAIETGLPFPKTRRIVHINQQPAALPGWVLLELAD